MTLTICLVLLLIVVLLPSFVWVWQLMPSLVEDQEEFERAMASYREPEPEP